MTPTDAAILNLADLLVPGLLAYATEGDHTETWNERARAATQLHARRQDMGNNRSGPLGP